MSTINEMELQNLRHLIMSHDMTSCKMEAYAQDAQTPEIKQYFQKASQTAADSKAKLLTFLR
ncbi:MAG: hypothetical protein ACLRZ7_04725 [Lachnospiraceae bacterium]